MNILAHPMKPQNNLTDTNEDGSLIFEDFINRTEDSSTVQHVEADVRIKSDRYSNVIKMACNE